MREQVHLYSLLIAIVVESHVRIIIVRFRALSAAQRPIYADDRLHTKGNISMLVGVETTTISMTIEASTRSSFVACFDIIM